MNTKVTVLTADDDELGGFSGRKKVIKERRLGITHQNKTAIIDPDDTKCVFNLLSAEVSS